MLTNTLLVELLESCSCGDREKTDYALASLTEALARRYPLPQVTEFRPTEPNRRGFTIPTN